MILMVIYKDNVYLRLGILAGMALTHEGGSMNVFSLSVFKCICGVFFLNYLKDCEKESTQE